MCVQHDARSASALARNHRAKAVIADFIGVWAQFVNHDFTHRLLETRRSRGFRQGAEKVNGSVLCMSNLRQNTACHRDEDKTQALWPWRIKSCRVRMTARFGDIDHVFS